MKYTKWIAIIVTAVILCILLTETVSGLLGVSTETAIFIIFSIAIPAVGFAYDCIHLSKINK